MQPINEARRRKLFTFSAAICAVPMMLAPIAARSSFQLAREQSAFTARFNLPAVPAPWKTAAVNVSRDPFIPERPYVSASDGVRETPPAAGGFASPAVRAVVTGPSPHALVDENGNVRVVSVGDLVAGSQVLAIDRTGIRLKNGTVLALAGDMP